MKINNNYASNHYLIKSNHRFPNSELPVILYKGILQVPSILPEFYIKKLFRKNGWYNSWNAGIFTYNHYHSITHEVLGFYKGETNLLLGGDNGIRVNVKKSDVLIIPAGVAHKNLGEEKDIQCIGAYPGGMDYDMNYGRASERPQTDKNIRAVPLPEKDPVLASMGEIQKHWKMYTGTCTYYAPLENIIHI